VYLVAATLMSACGDNAEPVLGASHDLVVVAHQDDDMLFIQPDLYTIVSRQQPVTIVYVTAGDAGQGIVTATARKRAVQSAYATVAASTAAWTCDIVDIAKHAVERCRLGDRPITLVFLAYPDGGVTGELPNSLLQLWEGSIDQATTVADVPATYDRDGLVRTVASIIFQTRPEIIRTLEVAGTHGDDHSDHMIVGALTQLALAATGSDAQLLSYRGYNINYESANVTETAFQQDSLFLRSYMACMTTCGECGVTACPTVEDPRYYAFLHRRYVVSMRDAPLAGALRSSAGCIGVDGESVELAACGPATPDIVLEDAGMLRLADQCLEVEDDGSLGLGACEPEPRRFFQLDSEGHLWSGVAPEPAPDMLYDHSTCVYASAGTVEAGLCGEHRDWTWQVVP
jgi:LmbE family N-acetylglucosaminyl deacetylase